MANRSKCARQILNDGARPSSNGTTGSFRNSERLRCPSAAASARLARMAAATYWNRQVQKIFMYRSYRSRGWIFCQARKMLDV
jgi:hypothetical protein